MSGVKVTQPVNGAHGVQPRARGTACSKRGLSLVELLVGLGLFALIMVLLSQVFLPGMRIWKRGRAIADIEQQAMVAEERIVRSLMATAPGAIQFLDDTDLKAISLLSHQGRAGSPGYEPTSGNSYWKEVLIFYVKFPEGILYQVNWDGTGGPGGYDLPDQRSFRMSPADIRTVVNSNLGERHRLAEKVTGLNLNPASENARPAATKGKEYQFLLRLVLSTIVAQRPEPAEVIREVSVSPRIREVR